MKYLIVFNFFFWWNSWNDLAFSQSSPLDNRISVDFNSEKLGKALKVIEKKGGFKFSYSRKIVPVQKKMTYQAYNRTISEVLKQILSPLGIEFFQVEKQIVLRRAKASKTESSSPLPATKPKLNHTLSGYIRDLNSGESLIGATIFIEELKSGSITNAYGFYSITIPEGDYTFSYSYIGFKEITKEVNLNQNIELDILLDEDTEFLQEVVVDASKSIPFIENVQKGHTGLLPISVTQMPALMGEHDVIKSLQSVPGIKLFADGSTNFHVRGGDRDQNLILLDEAPIYNPSHVLGLFSTIIPDAAKDINIYKGDLPVQQGGRLSSLIDIKTNEGNLKKLVFSGSLGLAASRLALEGPLKKDKSSFFISARFSNLNWFTKNIASSNANIGFYDFNTKFNVSLNKNNRLYFSFYSGLDNFEDIGNSGIRWGNFAGTIRWNHIFNSKLFSNTTLYSSSYNYYLITSVPNNDRWHSSIANISLKSDFSYFINPENNLYFGAKLSYHGFNPGNYEPGNGILPQSVPVVSKKNTNEIALYAGNEQQFFEKISIKYGLRLSVWQNIGPAVEYDYDENYNPIGARQFSRGKVYNSYAELAPRLGLAYQVGPGFSAKAFYSRSVQNVHLITNSISPFTNFEVWLPSSPNIKPQKADQVGGGLFMKWPQKGLALNGEIYYKWMDNQIDYADHASMILNPYIEGELRFGKGRAYGAEIQLEKKQGKLTGWIGYSYSRSFRKIVEINNGNEFPTYFDRPHEISLFLMQKLGRKWNISTNWIYNTGASYTTPTAFFKFESQTVPIYTERGNDRMPDYHRLDLSVNFQLNRPGNRFKHHLNFSIYNFYGRHNPVYLNFNKTIALNGDLLVPGDLFLPPDQTASYTYIYNFIPSVSYNFKL
ncbi:MAG: carboxypeptidase-like regulatory domain-containing protein [Cytophagales bacterium]|nr:carboxypeptidase-like regulatory domain-containing protein [Cytophagales bacterium]